MQLGRISFTTTTARISVSLFLLLLVGGYANWEIWYNRHNLPLQRQSDPVPDLQSLRPNYSIPALAASPVFSLPPKVEPVRNKSISPIPQKPAITQTPINVEVIGIVHAEGGQGVAILKLDGQIDAYKTGETLRADRSLRLVKVEQDEVSIQRDDYIKVIKLPSNGTQLGLSLSVSPYQELNKNSAREDQLLRSIYSQNNLTDSEIKR